MKFWPNFSSEFWNYWCCPGNLGNLVSYTLEYFNFAIFFFQIFFNTLKKFPITYTLIRQIARGVTHLVAQVARATPIISEFITIIWLKFHLRKMSFTLGNTNIFLEITPLPMMIVQVQICNMRPKETTMCRNRICNMFIICLIHCLIDLNLVLIISCVFEKSFWKSSVLFVF